MEVFYKKNGGEVFFAHRGANTIIISKNVTRETYLANCQVEIICDRSMHKKKKVLTMEKFFLRKLDLC